MTKATARRLLDLMRGAGATAGSLESLGGSGDGAAAARPGPTDARRIAAALGRARPGIDPAEAAALARSLTATAAEAIERMDGAPDALPDWALRPEVAVALEAVLHTRGRPALRIFDDAFEDLRDDPASAVWAVALSLHERALRHLAEATAAVTVRPRDGWMAPFVQGTAVMVGPGLALTNRHVLFPPAGGLALARRFPGTTRALLKGGLTVTLDFAHDDGTPGRGPWLAVAEVAFVAAPNDPVDAALLVLNAPGPAPLPVTAGAPPEELCVVGHPGPMAGVPDAVFSVFGTPDARKRLSFGRLMGEAAGDILHDASTIGGYSGAALSALGQAAVRGLHYWGDVAAGNRAVAAAALRGHPVLGPMLPR